MRPSFYLCLLALLCGGAFAQPASLAALPSDPHELATANVQTPATPSARATAMGVLERARQNSDMHMPGAAPFDLHVSFTALAADGSTPSGELTETWLSGQNWRWTA